MTLKRVLFKVALGAASLAALGTAVIGVAHTPWGRPLLKLPLLSALAQRAGCPAGSIEPAAFEKVRVTKLRGEGGSKVAGAHPALGFVLGQTRRTDVERWRTAQAASCKTGFVDSVLECENVAQAGAVKIAHLRLQFDQQQRLVSVDLFRSEGEQALVARFQELGAELDRQVGPATSQLGTPSLAFIKSSPLMTVGLTYNYRDYQAKATLLNLGKRGLRLREQYNWLDSPGPA